MLKSNCNENVSLKVFLHLIIVLNNLPSIKLSLSSPFDWKPWMKILVGITWLKLESCMEFVSFIRRICGSVGFFNVYKLICTSFSISKYFPGLRFMPAAEVAAILRETNSLNNLLYFTLNVFLPNANTTIKVNPFILFLFENIFEYLKKNKTTDDSQFRIPIEQTPDEYRWPQWNELRRRLTAF